MPNALDITPKTHAKLIETENYFVIMGNLYQKEDLSCISRNGSIFNNIAAGYNILNLNNYMMVSGNINPTYRHNDFGIVSDPYKSNRYYYIIDNRYTNSVADLTVANTRNWIVITEEAGDGDLNVIKTVSLTNYIFDNIIDIDETSIYVTAHYSADSDKSGIQIFKLNKDTGTNSLTIISYTNTNKINANLIYRDETYFYVLFPYNSNTDYTDGNRGKIRLLRYNKSNQEIKTNTYDFPGSGFTVHNNIDIQDFYKSGNKYYGIYLYKNDDNTDHILTACFDASVNFTDTTNVFKLNLSSTLSTENITWDDNFNVAKRMWIKNNYIYLAIYDESNTITTMITKQGIHVIKINSGFNLQYVGKVEFSNTKNAISLSYDTNKEILIIGYHQSFSIYTYNNTTHMYESVNKEITSVRCAGFDTMDRLWYETLTWGVHCENLDDPQEVTIKFEKPLYTYENHNINTYLTLSAKSYTDKPPVGRYVLTLSGNAYFDSTNDKTLNVNYTGNDTIHYPITITGPKRITCTVVFEKVWE